MSKPKGLNIIGLRDLVYGLCAGIVFGCILIAVLVFLVV